MTPDQERSLRTSLFQAAQHSMPDSINLLPALRQQIQEKPHHMQHARTSRFPRPLIVTATGVVVLITVFAVTIFRGHQPMSSAQKLPIGLSVTNLPQTTKAQGVTVTVTSVDVRRWDTVVTITLQTPYTQNVTGHGDTVIAPYLPTLNANLEIDGNRRSVAATRLGSVTEEGASTANTYTSTGTYYFGPFLRDELGTSHTVTLHLAEFLSNGDASAPPLKGSWDVTWQIIPKLDPLYI
jgi:hypothetical protein